MYTVVYSIKLAQYINVVYLYTIYIYTYRLCVYCVYIMYIVRILAQDYFWVPAKLHDMTMSCNSLFLVVAPLHWDLRFKSWTHWG